MGAEEVLFTGKLGLVCIRNILTSISMIQGIQARLYDADRVRDFRQRPGRDCCACNLGKEEGAGALILNASIYIYIYLTMLYGVRFASHSAQYLLLWHADRSPLLLQEWMLDFRLKAYRKWLTMAEPAWSDNR